MQRVFHAALLLLTALSLCSCGKSMVEKELEKFRAEGKPVTLTDLGIQPGEFKTEEWEKFVSISEELKKDNQLKELRKLRAGMVPAAAGVSHNTTLLNSATLDDTSLTWEVLDKRLGNTRQLLKKLPALSKEGKVLYLPDYRKGAGTPVPHVGLCLDLAKSNNLLILTDTARHRPDTALDLLESARLYNLRLIGGNNLIEGLVQVTCDGVLVGSSWALLHHENMDEARLLRLQRIWETTFQPQDVLRLWQGERIGFMRSLGKIRTLQDVRDFTSLSDEKKSSVQTQKQKDFLRLIPVKRWFDWDLATYLSFFRANENEIMGWEKTGNYLPLKKLVTEQQAFLENLGKFERTRYLLTNLAFPATDKALDHFAASMCLQRELQVAIALKRYHLVRKQYPASLTELVPDFLAALPSDPIDGQPLRYRLEKEGHYTLYSIGINGVDDGGNGEEMIPEKVPKWRADKTYDILWPRMK